LNSDLAISLGGDLNYFPTLFPELPAEYELKQEELGPQPDWALAWRDFYEPLEIGRLQIVPSWLAEETPELEEGVRLVLDPGRAFGTGRHESTLLLLQLLQEQALEGKRVLDLGTGSAILALAAAKLGAVEVVGTEIDPEAVEVALENVELSDLGDQVTILTGSLYEGVEGRFDLILCNILALQVIEAAGQAARYLAPGGLFFGSGFYEVDAPPVVNAIEAAGFAVELVRLGEWAAVSVKRA
jgi:ribosomal protein L11 methyltransferase